MQSSAITSKSRPPGPVMHAVGTLVYTRGGLFNVFAWMLWGDLCLNLMESVIPRMVPLQLHQLGASNALIGILTGSVFSLMNWILGPLISTRSDRHRSLLGRRMPYMLYPTPFLALFLAAIGFSGDLARWLQTHLPVVGHALAHGLSTIRPETAALAAPAQLTIALIAMSLVLYKLFDVFPQTVYYYLFTDVIPQSVMGTFICLFRVMATCGVVIFHYYLLPYANSHPRSLYLLCAGLYLISFTLLSLLVKEGDYPPPVPRAKRSSGAIVRWFKESFSSAFYWKYYLTYSCFRWAFGPFNFFIILYAQQNLGMDPGQFGHSMALAQAAQIPILFILAPLLDRWHPLRMTAVGFSVTFATAICALFLIHSTTSFLIFNLMTYIGIAIVQGSVLTLGPRLGPRGQYGQFCSAAAMVTESGLFIFSWACGKMLDHFGQGYLYLWLVVFSLAGFAANAALFYAWKKRGGDEHFVAPDTFIANTASKN